MENIQEVERLTDDKIYKDSIRYIERIRQLVGEELWDKVLEELKNGREVNHENVTALRNSV